MSGCVPEGVADTTLVRTLEEPANGRVPPLPRIGDSTAGPDAPRNPATVALLLAPGNDAAVLELLEAGLVEVARQNEWRAFEGVWFLRNAPDIAPRVEPVGQHDACFMPRSSHVTGDIGIHEVAWAAPRPPSPLL